MCTIFSMLTGMIDLVYELLDEHYPRDIGFIESRSPYEHLIAVIMSAQTTDRQVNLVTPELFLKYPTPADLAQADQADIERIIHPVGFYRVKARNIIAAAGVIHESFNDEVPHEMDSLLSIPGVGRKSANVIRGGCYGYPAVIVDTHFGRVVYRIGLTESKNPDVIEKDITGQIVPEKQYRFSMTVNLHGREICHAKKPECGECLLVGLCLRRGLL